MIEEEVEHFMDNDPSWKTWQADDITEWGTLTDVVDALSEITILTASRTLQGKEVRAGLDKSFAGLYTDLDGGFTPLNFMFPNLPLPSYRRRDVAQARMSTFYQDIIARRRARGSVAGDDEHDMLAALMEQTYRSGRPLQDHEMAHIMIALLMAGQHTSSATGSWALLHLAANPAVADELYEEQVKHFGQPDGSFRSMTFEELRDLPVLDSVIRETLRLHPPIHSIMRYVQDAVPVPATLGAPAAHKRDAQPYVVPVGHYVLASPLVSQMDPGTWRDATAWEPARWLDPAGVAARAFAEYTDEGGEKIDFGFGAVSKGTDSPYQPFGAGRHRCIGEQFAYLQLGTIIATIIRRVEVRLQGAFPAHNYHVRDFMGCRAYVLTPSADDDYDADLASQDFLSSEEACCLMTFHVVCRHTHNRALDYIVLAPRGRAT
jgi:sterol 14-demethylase